MATYTNTTEFDPFFDRVGLLTATEQFKNPESFVLDTFFKEMDVSVDVTVRVDFYDELSRLAPYVHRKVKGQLVETKGQKAFFYRPPYIKQKTTITPDDLRKVVPGSNPYAGTSLAENMATLIARKMNDMNRPIERREELQAIQAIMDGEIPIVDENNNPIDESIVFTRDTALTTGATANWATTTTSDPIEDFRDDSRLIADLTGLQADTIILGSDLVTKFKNSTAVKDQLDNRRIEDGSFAQRAISLGARYIGNVEGFNIYTYNWKYSNSSNELVDAFPANKYLIGSSMSRNVRLYGGIEDINAVVPAQRFPKSWVDEELGIRWMQVDSAPLMATLQPNAFRVRTVTVA